MMKNTLLSLLCFFVFTATHAQNLLEPVDIFDIEYVSDPQISPDGTKVIYTRNFKDIMTDKNLSNLWVADVSGDSNRPLTTGNQNDRSARWSPDGKMIVYISNKSGSNQIYLRWMDTGAESKLSNLQESPRALQWSPDGKWIAFSKFVPGEPKVLAPLKGKPKGANWNDPAIYIDDMKYRSDGAGYLPQGNNHLFIISADGGSPRQVTKGDYNFNSAVWEPSGKHLISSSNTHEDREMEPNNSEVHKIEITSGTIKTLTDRLGPDANPKVSPDGSKIAYVGFDDKYEGYQLARLYLMDSDGSNPRLVSGSLDRSINDYYWNNTGDGFYITYDNEGDIVISHIGLNNELSVVATNAGGVSIGRPYAAGSFTVSKNGVIAFTLGGPDHPADLGVSSAPKQYSD